MKKPKVLHDEWRVLSKKFVRHHCLPHGTKIILRHRAPGRGSGRQARNDLTVARHLFKGRAQDNDTVTTLFSKFLHPALLTNLAARGLEPVLVGPNGETAKANNLTIAKIRAWPALPTPDQIEADELKEAEIEEISKLADLELRGAEELRDDPDRVLRGYLRALIRRFGGVDVKEALARELGE